MATCCCKCAWTNSTNKQKCKNKKEFSTQSKIKNAYKEEKNNEQDDNIDIHLAEVSLSPYHIQDYEDCGEDRVEKIPLYGPIAELLEKFVEFHFHPEEFKKRKRDKKDIDQNVKRGGDARLKLKNTYN